MPPMPPKPAPESEEDFSDEDDENESESDSEDTDSSEEDTTTTESSEEEEEFSAGKKGPTNATAVIKNKPHDEEFHVTNSSAPAGSAPAKQPATKQPAPAAAQQPGRGPVAGHSVVQNRAHDEEFQVESAPNGNNKAAPKPAAKAVQPTNTGGASSGKLTNTHMDEFEDVENDVPDSPKKAPAQAAAAKQQTQQPVRAAPSGVGEREIKNNKADLEFVVNPNAKSGAGLAVPAPGKMTTMKPPTPSDSSASSGSDRDTDEEDEESHHNSSAHNQRRNDNKQVGAVDTSLLSSNMSSGPTVTTGATSGLEYNPNDYLHVTQSVPADVRDIFAYITAYSATAMECPAKLRPFIPDYIPSVGDIDTFCKVPRPDDKPDQYGLAVVDEPSSRMSNPTIIKQILIQTETGTPVVSIEDQLMDSLRDASRKPEAIDKWIEDVRLVHGKKAAPTVYYSKPMPSIDSLMQAWPPGFEDVLNSDLQLPPPNIDLDMEQYVRMLCAILDIPVHTNLVESLHVMFTLYLEFRENQHFKAA